MKKIYSIFIVIFHFLYLYASPIATLSIGDCILLPFFLVLLLKTIKKAKNKKIKISSTGLFLCFYITIQFLFVFLFKLNDDFNNVLFAFLRILLYYLTVFLFSKEYFDVELGFKVLKYISVISTLFLFLQYIFLTFFGMYIPGEIPGLKLLNKELELFNTNMIDGYIEHRPRSFFTEPSYYAIYVLLYLIIDLLCLKKHDYKSIIIVTLGLLLSASGTGILTMGLIYFIFIIKNFLLFNRKSVILLTLIIIIILIAFPIYRRSNTFNVFYERTFVDKTSTDGRFGTYELIFNSQNDSFPVKLFGRSIEKIDIYIAGVPRIFYYFGYLGFALFFILSSYYLYKLKSINKLSLLLLIILSFGTEAMFSYMFLIYGSFIVANTENKIYYNNSIKKGVFL